MKNASFIFSIIAIVAVAVLAILMFPSKDDKSEPVSEETSTEAAARKGDIVYVQLDRILQEYDMANDLRSVVDTKVQNIQAEVNRRGQKLQSDISSFQEKLNKGLLTRSVAEAQGEKLRQQEQEFNQYANEKNNEVIEEQTVMMNQLADAIKTYLDKYNAEKQYAMILTNQGGAPVITGDPALDITDDVLAGLNDEYVKNKNKKEK